MDRSDHKILLTVGIATVGRGSVLIDTIESALQEMDESCMELLVADQNEELDAETHELLSKLEDESRVIRLRLTRPSLTRARNEIIHAARAEVVCFIDDDVIVPPGFFQKHLLHYAQPRIASVTGQVFHKLRDTPEVDISHPDQGTTKHFHAEEAGETDTSIGCNHSVRVSAVKAIGGYDEAFVAAAHCEDFDIIHRLTLAGFTGWYDPEAWLIHLRAPAGGCRVKWDSSAGEWTHTANLFLYAFRHGKRKNNFWDTVRKALRTGPGRKEILFKPWRIPFAWVGMIRGLIYGCRHKQFARSPLFSPVHETPSEDRA